MSLARGDLGEAQSKLREGRTRFPQGQLVEEREALEVRVAAASGDHAEATRLAKSFVARHPESPLRPAIQAIAERDEKE